jgi:hypothetical protein
MKKLMALIGLILFTATPLAYAEVSDEEFQKMQQILEQALQRIDELERQQAVVDSVQQAEIGAVAGTEVATAEQVAANTAKLEKMSWAERIKWKGDFRYRYQPEEAKGIIDDEVPYDPIGTISRNRQRIRARTHLEAALSDSLEVGFGLATGGDNPVSANTTLGGGGSKKEINLDLAYFDWEFFDNANMAMGKFENSFFVPAKAGLLWDGDWRPEGFDLRYVAKSFYAKGLGTWLSSDASNGSGNAFNYGVQTGFTPKLGNARLNIGGGYYKFKADGQECIAAPSEGSGAECFGNTYELQTVDGEQVRFFVMDYAPVELFAQVDFGTSLPFGLFADFAKNVDAEAIATGPSAGKKLDTAYAAGGWLGNGKKKGEWQLKAYYQDKEADSVLGLLTDSDFTNGGTDAKGWVAKGKYMFTDQVYFQLSALLGERLDSNGNENGDPATANPYDVNLMHFDLQFKYK